MAHRTQSLRFGEHLKAVLEEATGEGFAPVNTFPRPVAVPWAQLRELLEGVLQKSPMETRLGPAVLTELLEKGRK